MLSELNVRHTRRHVPTRRVALDPGYLPMRGSASGAVLLGAVVAEFVSGLDEEQEELLPRLVRDARDGLAVPRIALRYRLQTDVHGLDRSRHRLLAGSPVMGSGAIVLELDVHGHPVPQVLGAVLAAAMAPPTDRVAALRAVEAGMRRPGELPEGVEVRRLLHGVPGARPAMAAAGPVANGAGLGAWAGVPIEQRWAMEVLGLGAGTPVERDDILRRFRLRLRGVHPDHGAADAGAAERIAELTEAREVLFAVLTEAASTAGRQ